MKVEERSVDSLIPYARNPRQNDEAVGAVAASIKEFGFKQPIVVDAEGVIVAGHTRLKAAQKLGLVTVPVIVADDLTEDQVKAYRLLDNRVGEIATWDAELLALELKEIDLDLDAFDVDFDDVLAGVKSEQDGIETAYSMKIKAPVYEPQDERPPPVSELYDLTKFHHLSELIEKSSAPGPVKAFLRWAAHRHVVFDYQSIAEFYAHADPEVQELMEDSALVIIDFEKAIEQGFVDLSHEVAAAFIENQKNEAE